MSSNIKVRRICEYCGKEFVGQKTTTRYCSPECNRKDYKQKSRNARILKAEDTARQRGPSPEVDIEQIKAKEFLTAREAALLLGTSRRTLYRMIETRLVNAVNLTIIRRSDIEALFNDTRTVNKEPAAAVKTENKPLSLDEWVQTGGENINDCYTINEVMEKYCISETAVLNLIKRNEVPRLKIGWYHYVSKKTIDSLFGNIL